MCVVNKKKEKYDTEWFIKKAKDIHGDRYDYSLVKYTGMHSKIKIICKKHGMFEQKANDHTNKKCGCKKCTQSLNYKDFIVTANKLHNDKYDYSLLNDMEFGYHELVQIKCPIHGIFLQKPSLHLDSHGCQKCAGTVKLTTESFITRAREIHGDKYDYSLVKYVNMHSKVEIICKDHGSFFQKAYSHILSKRGCTNCASTKKLTTDDFIKKAIEVHGDKYDYSLVKYVNSATKVLIKCPTHGVFEMVPNNHVSQKQSCPSCRESKGETGIRLFLIKNNIEYKKEKTFDDCRVINPLPFDFHLPKLNICIEYDGIQHFKPVERFGGLQGLERTKYYDSIKTNYCEQNNIKLIRIPYNKNITEILTCELNVK